MKILDVSENSRKLVILRQKYFASMLFFAEAKGNILVVDTVFLRDGSDIIFG